jgi:hypothetical protein
MLLRACLLTGAVVLAVSACGDDDGASTTVAVATTEAASTTAESTTTTEPTTTTEAATTTEGATTTVAAGPLSGALLTVEDLGEGFVATSDDSEPDDTTPCGTPSPGSVVGSGERDSVDLTNEERGLQLSQTINRYADEAVAQRAMTLGQAGLACGSGTSTNDDGSTVEFELEEVELSSPIGDQAFAYSGTATADGQAFDIIFVAIRDGRAVTALTFLSVQGEQGPAIEPILATVEQKLATIA